MTDLATRTESETEAPGATPPIIMLRDVARSYKMGASTVAAVDGIDLSVAPGEFIALMGASGSGKSTLLNLLGGLDQPSAGEIWVAGVNLTRARPRALVEHRRRRVGFVFQSFNLLAHRTALENVEIPLMLAGVAGPARRARALALLAQVGLAGRADHEPSQL